MRSLRGLEFEAEFELELERLHKIKEFGEALISRKRF